MNNHCKFSETVAQNQISSPNPPARPKKSYSIVWKACPCLRLRLRHRLRLRLRLPRSAIPSIASIASITHLPASPYTAVRHATGVFFFGGADFFSAKRLFFRAARDVSGERSAPPWAREEIKLKMSFQSLSHSPSHERAKPSHPRPRLFIHFHTTMPTSPPNPSSIHQVESIQSVGSVGSIASIHPKKSNIPYWYCLQ